MPLKKNKFEFGITPILLLLAAAILRYLQMHAVVGMVRKLEPYQYQTYLTMAIVLTYIIDCAIGTRALSIYSIASIVLVLSGVLMIGSFKLEFNSLNKDILIRVATGIFQGYVTYYILRYWSNAVYIFGLNMVLTLPFLKRYNMEYHHKQANIIKWVFIQQTFGFAAVYITNMLMSQSVTLGVYVVPASIVMSFLFSFIKNYSGKSLSVKNLTAIALVISGILLLR